MLVGGKTHAADISAQNGLVAKKKQNNLTITAEDCVNLSTEELSCRPKVAAAECDKQLFWNALKLRKRKEKIRKSKTFSSFSILPKYGKVLGCKQMPKSLQNLVS